MQKLIQRFQISKPLRQKVKHHLSWITHFFQVLSYCVYAFSSFSASSMAASTTTFFFTFGHCLLLVLVVLQLVRKCASKNKSNIIFILCLCAHIPIKYFELLWSWSSMPVKENSSLLFSSCHLELVTLENVWFFSPLIVSADSCSFLFLSIYLPFFKLLYLHVISCDLSR